MAAVNSRRRMQVYRTMHLWHWISAAVCFAALILFTVTGITLNHASAFSADPVVKTYEAKLPPDVLATLTGSSADAVLPESLERWLEREFAIELGDATAEWSEEELYLSAPGPGRDAWISIDRETGVAKSETTDRGWLAYFNDLHKGRNTGLVWTIFIDVVAAACLFFALTGMVLLWIQARQRKSTRPLLTGGVGLVIALMIFFAH
jgi:uncharacterized protein